AVERRSRRRLQVAQGGTRGETVLTTSDGRILVAQTSHIDEIAPLKAPQVVAASVSDGALLPLPVNQIAVRFDQAMWAGLDGQDVTDLSSVLNTGNYRLVATGDDVSLTLNPESVRWDASTRTAVLSLPSLSAGGWRLEISDAIRSVGQVRLSHGYAAAF